MAMFVDLLTIQYIVKLGLAQRFIAEQRVRVRLLLLFLFQLTRLCLVNSPVTTMESLW